MSKNTFCSFAVSVFVALAAVAQQPFNPDSIARRLERQVGTFPQEKVHVMTDKQHYVCGDTIWFRGFVVDAATHKEVSASRYLYVELVNPFAEVIERVKIMERDGAYEGYIPLDPFLAEGDYGLTAYTMFMKNVGEDYFFKKNVQLTSPFSLMNEVSATAAWRGEALEVEVSYVDRTTGGLTEFGDVAYTTCKGVTHDLATRKNPVAFTLKGDELRQPYVQVEFDNYAKFLRLPHREDFGLDVTFHPEGGYLVAGECRVAFKALGPDGLGNDVAGRVLDDDGREVAEFVSAHLGMGCFDLKVEPGAHYVAVVSDNSGRTSSFELPKVMPDATVLRVKYADDTLFVSAAGRQMPYGWIFIQQRGLMRASSAIRGGEVVAFDKSCLVPGVAHVMLADADARVLSERLVFVRDDGNETVALSTDKPAYGNRERVEVSVNLQGYENPLASLAVAVTDDSMASAVETNSIEAQLLLQSDLSGLIEEPDYYFQVINDTTDRDLDVLMLTQGWRRYDIQKIIRGELEMAGEPLEIGEELSGVVRRFFGKPMAGANVSVISPEVGFSSLVRTDDQGVFRVVGADYPEGTPFIFQANKDDGDKIYNFDVFETTYPEPSFLLQRFDAMIANDESEAVGQFVSANPSLKSILLDEVVVTGTRHKRVVPQDIYQALSRQSYRTDELGWRATSLHEAVRLFPEVREGSNGGLYYRGQPVAFIVNGVVELGSNGFAPTLAEVESRYAWDMIGRVDFITPQMSVVFGSSTMGGGAIVLTLKHGGGGQGNAIPPYMQVVLPLGYQLPVERYEPKYEATSDLPAQADVRSTVHWQPLLATDEAGNATFTFYTSDVRNTSYTVMIEGLTADGHIVENKHKIIVD